MSKYHHLSKEELLILIEKQEQELKNKKYGLVWDTEREPEQVVLDCKNHLPVLERVKSKEIKTDDSEDNILIEGDNYHALTVLNYTHKGKIDVIYIDPPYNTGNKDFIYNDKYVEKDDSYRHSKWLNFMEKRLKLAKELLKDDGVIFVSIDDNEIAQLKLLMDKVFGENNFITIIVNQSAKSVFGSKAAHKEKTIIKVKDYVVVYKKRNIQISPLYVKSDKPIFTSHDFIFEDGEKISTQEWFRRKHNDYFKDKGLKITKENIVKALKSDEDFYRKVFNELLDIQYRTGGEYKKEVPFKIQEALSQGKIVYYDNVFLMKENVNSNTIYFLRSLRESCNYVNGEFYKVDILGDVWDTSKGYGNINAEGDVKFKNGKKPLILLKNILNLFRHKNNLVVLDFFAGSGTTGHAVLELNKEDGGNRRFILVTNNEENIATQICYPRLKKVIKGYNRSRTGEWVEGLGGNLQYFKTSLIKKSKNRDQVKIDLTQKATEMLCVKENIYNLEKEGEDYKIFSSNKKDRFLCIYYNFIDDSFNEFLEELKKLNGKKIIYMFAIDNKVDKSLFSELNDFTIEPIPQKILDVYNQLVKMNIPIKVETIFIDLEKAKKQIFENEDKDTGAKILRVVLEKLLQKIAQLNQINILNDKGKEIKISNLNDILKVQNVLSQVEWQENQTYLTIGNHASHGEYDEYNLEQVKNFYKHIQSLIDKFNI